MGRQRILALFLIATATLGLACGGSPATQPPSAASPTVSAPSAAPSATAGVAATKAAPTLVPSTSAPAPYPVATPATNAPAPAAAPGGPYPVVSNGQSLMNERCTVCHDTARIQSAKKTRAEWESTVAKEKAKGAKLTDAETAILVDFLAATYK